MVSGIACVPAGCRSSRCSSQTDHARASAALQALCSLVSAGRHIIAPVDRLRRPLPLLLTLPAPLLPLMHTRPLLLLLCLALPLRPQARCQSTRPCLSCERR